MVFFKESIQQYILYRVRTPSLSCLLMPMLVINHQWWGSKTAVVKRSFSTVDTVACSSCTTCEGCLRLVLCKLSIISIDASERKLTTIGNHVACYCIQVGISNRILACFSCSPVLRGVQALPTPLTSPCPVLRASRVRHRFIFTKALLWVQVLTCDLM